MHYKSVRSATTALAGNTSIPSTLTDLGISDGSANQVLSTNGSGTFTFVNQSGGGGATQDADGDTKIQVEEGTDDDTIRFDTAGVEMAIVSSGGGVGSDNNRPWLVVLVTVARVGSNYAHIRNRAVVMEISKAMEDSTMAQKDDSKPIRLGTLWLFGIMEHIVLFM